MNCLIYPFKEYHESLIRAVSRTRNDIDITVRVVPRGCAPALKERGYEFTTDFNEAMAGVEGVIICDCRSFPWMKKDLIEKIKLALANGKTVYNCNEMNSSDLEEIAAAEGFESSRFINYGCYPDLDSLGQAAYCDVECPLVAIGNMLGGLDDATGLYELTKSFTEMGFRTVPIGLTFDCRLAGGYVLPLNLFDGYFGEDTKIEMFNTFVNDVQLLSGADVIVMDIPDGLMKYSKEIVEGYGIRSLMVSSAISVDYFVLNTPFNQVDPENIASLKNHLEQKYNLSIDTIAIDSRSVDHAETIEDGRLMYCKVDDSAVDEMVGIFNSVQTDIPVIRLNNRDVYADVAAHCKAKLS